MDKYKRPGEHWPAFAKKLRRLVADAIRLWYRQDELPAEQYQSRRDRLHKRLGELIDTPWEDKLDDITFYRDDSDQDCEQKNKGAPTGGYAPKIPLGPQPPLDHCETLSRPGGLGGQIPDSDDPIARRTKRYFYDDGDRTLSLQYAYQEGHWVLKDQECEAGNYMEVEENLTLTDKVAKTFTP